MSMRTLKFGKIRNLELEIFLIKSLLAGGRSSRKDKTLEISKHNFLFRVQSIEIYAEYRN